jgi:hypothetical protein
VTCDLHPDAKHRLVYRRYIGCTKCWWMRNATDHELAMAVLHEAAMLDAAESGPWEPEHD